MKKVLGILAAVLVLGAVALAGLQPWGFSLLGVEFAWSPEYREVQQLGRQFMEDIEFKDWDRAASYHTWAEKQEADIPEQIRRLFGIKPEQLHIENVRLMGVDISEDGLRARTRFKTHVEVLNSAQTEEEDNRNRDLEINLYWQRRPASEALPEPGSETEPKAGEPPADPTTQDPAAKDPTAKEPAPAKPDRPDAQAPPSADGETRWFLFLRDSLDENAALPR
ncbi:MAG: hypothetical protein KDD82_13600 [Planctomycetes bacterium]|nr:hypothetical protein [Planctomycetota bacterium]